eukprot:137409-Pleurochrysis_carterae.AAC.1
MAITATMTTAIFVTVMVTTARRSARRVAARACSRACSAEHADDRAQPPPIAHSSPNGGYAGLEPSQRPFTGAKRVTRCSRDGHSTAP